MDDADRARHLQTTLNESAARFRKPVPRLEPVGHCHTCGELIDAPRLFCNSNCCELYDRENMR